jgi:hypothetical protein
MYFFAIEITRRRLATVISRFAVRARFSPAAICLLILRRSASGSATRACRSIMRCCSSLMAGTLRPSTALYG